MCGILGLATRLGQSPSLDDRQMERARDLLTHRGPDSAGMWSKENVLLAHRRLIVIDPSHEAGQPMLLFENGRVGQASPVGAPPTLAIVYNGELYNEPELRRELASLGHRFNTNSDTETVLRAFDQWGTDALRRMRGMFALALHDARRNLLTLARDPMGVKPLYHASVGTELMFASEPGPLLAHPAMMRAPNERMIAAYLMTIRTTLGDETLFRGIRSVPPGCMLQCDLSPAGTPPATRLVRHWSSSRLTEGIEPDDAAIRVRAMIEESVRGQLRADVPVCTLLSGGLDSTIITAIARRLKPDLLTYSAGAPIPSDCRDEAVRSDLHFARLTADELGTRHAEALVTRELFNDRWPEMVRRLCVPLSTPNEVAIHEVACRLRADGCIVTLSGEGADELFAGYDMPLDAAASFHAANPGASCRDAAMHELASSAWAPADFLPGVLREDSAGSAEWAASCYEDELSGALEECAGDWIAARQRLLRRVNLTGLLQRLDTATMLAGVEGRTPFADAEVAALAESLPMWMKFEQADQARHSHRRNTAQPGRGGSQQMLDVMHRQRTKLILREAFAGDVPEFVMERPKASFPLPFQPWLADHAEALKSSSFARSVFADAAIEAVAAQPEKLWRLAWPMMNLARWGDAMGW